MYRFALLLTFLTISVTSGYAQSATSPAGRSALDKAVLEDYVRHLFVWGPQITVKVGDPKPSQSLPGFREVSVVATAGQASQEATFYISADGRKIIQGNVYDVTKNPFEGDLDKI